MQIKEEKTAYNKARNATLKAKAARRAYRATPKAKAARRAIYATPEGRAKAKAYNIAHPDKYREATWRSQGIDMTWTQYEAMFPKQNYKCGICGIGLVPTKEQCVGNQVVGCVDHNHNTKEVRGLLCHRCNTGLGNFNDDPVLMGIGKAYLEFRM